MNLDELQIVFACTNKVFAYRNIPDLIYFPIIMKSYESILECTNKNVFILNFIHLMFKMNTHLFEVQDE